MVRPIAVIRETWNIYTPVERRNIAMYIAGIMMYKFGLEAFNGSVIALATNRYDDLGERMHTSITFQRVGVLTGLNQAFQCVGSILIAPLIKRYPTKNVLACAVLIFALMSSLLLILDAATGGRFAPRGWPEDDFSYYGDYNTDAMIPICKSVLSVCPRIPFSGSSVPAVCRLSLPPKRASRQTWQLVLYMFLHGC